MTLPLPVGGQRRRSLSLGRTHGASAKGAAASCYTSQEKNSFCADGKSAEWKKKRNEKAHTSGSGDLAALTQRDNGDIRLDCSVESYRGTDPQFGKASEWDQIPRKSVDDMSDDAFKDMMKRYAAENFGSMTEKYAIKQQTLAKCLHSRRLAR